MGICNGQWREGGEREGRSRRRRTRTGVSKYAKDDPKAELTETANANARFLSSSRFLSKSKYDSARAHRAADSRRWKDAKNSASPRGIALSHSDYSVRAVACVCALARTVILCFPFQFFLPRSVGKSDTLMSAPARAPPPLPRHALLLSPVPSIHL